MILFGASGHCKSVIDIAESIGVSIEIIYDDNPKVEAVCHIPVQEYSTIVLGLKGTWLISIGNNKNRKEVSERLNKNFGMLIHKTASISSWSSLGDGTVIMAKVVVNTCATIGKHCIINSGAVVEHDCIIENYAHISPNVSLAGGVTVGEGSHIGIGASVLPEIKIGKWAIIGAGAVIINDVPDGAVVVGNPGKIINKND
ncbi:acetyltransferase [Aequorivita sp. SDUM287046]|uniref:Acetyltransferase n=1 Tax=Aequorivita aurantiaca TaxID=3053356 RepID=A0ABT8DGY3_9FLAO|nr:acetyltransferase [Aequorivita aurantiaca]MDN3723959.1 acetyltransferase [Aequorivita aurantiaca]